MDNITNLIGGFRNSLFNSGIKYKTDKITHHGYERFYDHFLVPLKNDHMNVFEIGIDAGRSLKMWNDFFPNAKIYGLDIGYEYKHPKGEIFKGDQSDIKVLKNATEKIGKCKIIIDDGSHEPTHQLLGFNYLFTNMLEDGGIYIIEDIETSYWSNGELYGYIIKYGFKSKNNIVRIFKKAVDIVNREFLTDKYISKMKRSKIDYEALSHISMISFGANCIIIKKMTEHEYKKYANRKYRFGKFL